MAKNDLRLPPLASKIVDGRIEWKLPQNIDFEVLGYFLSCHLIVEHYLEEFLAGQSSELDWPSAKLTFGQKINLLAKIRIDDPYNFLPALKHFNALRNKLSHRLEFKISMSDMSPFIAFLRMHKKSGAIPGRPEKILELFMARTCSWLAGGIWSHANRTKRTRDENA